MKSSGASLPQTICTALGLTITQARNSEPPLWPPSPACSAPHPCQSIPLQVYLQNRSPVHSLPATSSTTALGWATIPLTLTSAGTCSLVLLLPLLSCSLSPVPQGCLGNLLKMDIWLCHGALKMQSKLFPMAHEAQQNPCASL